MSPNVPSEQRDAILETSRKSMHRHVRRKYDTYVSCKICKQLHIVSDKTISYLCPNCGKFNSVSEANNRYQQGDFQYELKSNSEIGAPSIKSMDHNKKDYFNLRDEFEIRADLFAKGVTRNSMGVDKFNNTLRKELKNNKCYRGFDKTGV